MDAEIKMLDAAKLKELLSRSDCHLIDVREDFEYAAEHIPGSVSFPLSAINTRMTSLPKGIPFYVICRSGSRARQAAKTMVESGSIGPVYVVEGGLEACKAAGIAVQGGSRKIWSMERQVRAAAGLLIVSGVMLAWALHSAFALLSLFVGAGLIFSAVTDTCGMALVLAKMPWNSSASCCRC